jgi:hypothetical protein
MKMKQILLFTSLMLCVYAQAQQQETNDITYDVFPARYKTLPTNIANSAEFPINKKFTIKLSTSDSIHFDFSTIHFERYNGSFNYGDLASNFSKDSTKNGTLEMYFCIGIRGLKQAPGDRSARVLLVMKNRTGIDLAYDVETQKKIHSKKYVPDTNSGVEAGTIAIEKWDDMLNDIRLSNFRIKETSKKK